MLTFIDQKIREAFSGAAMQYDALSGLHRAIGRELFKEIVLFLEGANFKGPVILDLGMGTGWLTRRLTTHLSQSVVLGLDAAVGMVQEARRKAPDLLCVQADARILPVRSCTFDVITSNLSLQWVPNLDEVFISCHRALKPQGGLLMTMFGQGTFQELFDALHATRPTQGQVFKVRRLAGVDAVEAALTQSGFQRVQISNEMIQTRFASMDDLLIWIKRIGANALPREGYVGKEWLARARAYYEAHAANRLGVKVSFEVVSIKAEK